MRKALWALPLVVVVVWALYPRTPALADAPRPHSSSEVVELEPLPHERILAPEHPIEDEVLEALRAWNPRARAGSLATWAAAIADGTLSRSDAIWMASQGSVESKFAPWVLDFSCNKTRGWRACDHGNAVGPFQMWEHGMKLVDTSPEVQVREAYRRMRANPHAWTTWREARAQADQWLATHGAR